MNYLHRKTELMFDCFTLSKTNVKELTNENSTPCPQGGELAQWLTFACEDCKASQMSDAEDVLETCRPFCKEDHKNHLHHPCGLIVGRDANDGDFSNPAHPLILRILIQTFYDPIFRVKNKLSLNHHNTKKTITPKYLSANPANPANPDSDISHQDFGVITNCH